MLTNISLNVTKLSETKRQKKHNDKSPNHKGENVNHKKRWEKS
jgi:hypothetical protein